MCIRAPLGACDLDEAAALLATPSLELSDQAASDAAAAVGRRDGDGGEAEPPRPVVEERDDRGAREAVDVAADPRDQHALLGPERGERRGEERLVGLVPELGDERRERARVARAGIADLGGRRYAAPTARRPARNAATASSTTTAIPTRYSIAPTPSWVTSAWASEKAAATSRRAQMSGRSLMR
jgi:hypothetical protein